MRLETKLAASSCFVIAIMMSSTIIAHLRFRQEHQLYNRVAATRLPALSLAQEARFTTRASVRQLESYLLFGSDPGAVAHYAQHHREIVASADADINRLLQSAQAISPAETARVRDLQSRIAELSALEDQAEALNEQPTPDAATQAHAMLQQQVLPLDRQLSAAFDAFASAEQTALDNDIAQLDSGNRSVTITLWTSTLLAGLFSAFVSFFVSRRLTRSVQRLADRAVAIATGDLTGKPLVLGNAEQMCALAGAMQDMQESLGTIIGTVADTASSLTQSAASMRLASDQVHRRVDEQTQQTQQTAAALQEMSASIAEVSRHTQSAVESARSAAQTAREGGTIVRQVLDAMHSVDSGFSTAFATISLLGEDSRRISQIVTVIDEIARKTNLLALNAAIEAARAGDQGRGFAVVAGEVRHLAESTAQATSEIAAMIKAVQTRTEAAIANAQAGSHTIEQGVITTSQAGEALERIIGMAERVERMITQIAIAAGQQATAADQSSVSLDSIHLLSNENLAELATTTAGIEELRRTAVTLQNQVERFRLTPAAALRTTPIRAPQHPGSSQLTALNSQPDLISHDRVRVLTLTR